MKNERRHKLSQNSLARILENSVSQTKTHSATIMRIVMVILIAVLIVLVWRKFATGNRLDFYNDIRQLSSYNSATLDAKQFDNVAQDYLKKYPSGANHATISLLIGDVYFNQAFQALTEGKRDEAIAGYEKALEFYTTADKFNLKQQDLAESAVWGLAQTNESLAALKEGEYIVDAKGLYERLCKTWPDGAYHELAAPQLQWLNRPLAGSFLTQYRDADPKLFVPDLKTPETTGPLGNLDTTITPGDDIQSLLDRFQTEDGTPSFDPGLTLPEDQKPEEPAQQEAAQTESTEGESTKDVTPEPTPAQEPTPTP